VCYNFVIMTDSYNQENINLNAKLFVRQRVISGAESASSVMPQDSAGIVGINTTVIHTVTIPPANSFPRGFFVRYMCSNASAFNVVFARTAPDTINLLASDITIATDQGWILLDTDGDSNWWAFVGGP
jgi:hypothetical protein